MKLFVALSVIFVAANGFHTKLSEISERQGRIASGQPIPKGRYLDFCSLSIKFFQKQKTCGCVVLDEYYVGTTARCLVDLSEGPATNVTVTVAGKPYPFEKIIIPKEGDLGAEDAPFPAYFPEADLVTAIAPSNIAGVKLAVPLKIDGKTISAFAPAEIDDLALFFEQVGPEIQYFKFYACGVGITNNQRAPTKGPLCTQVKVALPGECKNFITGEPLEIELAPEQFCIQWPNRDNNICAGDYGGPIYASITFPPPPGEKPGPPIDRLLGFAVGSPDARPNAHCQDGHTVIGQLLNYNVFMWAQNQINPVAPIPPDRSWTPGAWKELIKSSKP